MSAVSPEARRSDRIVNGEAQREGPERHGQAQSHPDSEHMWERSVPLRVGARHTSSS